MKFDCYFITIKPNLHEYYIFSFFACYLALLLSWHFCLLTCAFALLAERRLSVHVPVSGMRPYRMIFEAVVM